MINWHEFNKVWLDNQQQKTFISIRRTIKVWYFISLQKYKWCSQLEHTGCILFSNRDTDGKVKWIKFKKNFIECKFIGNRRRSNIIFRIIYYCSSVQRWTQDTSDQLIPYIILFFYNFNIISIVMKDVIMCGKKQC
jgi:hypothetical protein